ncbi:MAG: sulfotransferase [Planctomycetes bacterium]|nr:sulfotransferase [Planctomycetota bacterium]
MDMQELFQDKMIIIGGLPRSGKSLLRNLIGSHSQITILPSGFSFFHYFSEKKFSERGCYQDNLDFFFESYRKNKKYKITKETMVGKGNNRRDLFINIIESYRRAHYPHKKYAGVYNHVVEEYFDTLIEWFGFEGLKFIQIVRNPYDNYASCVVAKKVSLRERQARNPHAFIHRFCNMWSQSAVMGISRAL